MDGRMRKKLGILAVKNESVGSEYENCEDE
jgi:hypothetical protein